MKVLNQKLWSLNKMSDKKFIVEQVEKVYEEQQDNIGNAIINPDEYTDFHDMFMSDWNSKHSKSIKSMGDFVSAGTDIIAESESYEEFYIKQLELWHKKIDGLVGTSKIGEKSFGEFLSGLFNVVNSLPFTKKLKVFINSSMKSGLESAEEETGIDIGVTENFNKRADFFVDEELNGYTLPNGKKWHGIKGATEEIRQKIYDEIKEGIVNKESQKELRDRVKTVFDGAKNTQAVRIARTESNRFVNFGKLQGYMDSGLSGKKQWIAIDDDRTSDVCKQLDGQIVGLNENFSATYTEGKKTMYWEGQAPPSHPLCRSTLIFIPD